MRSSWRNTVPVSQVCSSSAFALATWLWWSPEADDLCVFQLKARGVLGLSMEKLKAGHPEYSRLIPAAAAVCGHSSSSTICFLASRDMKFANATCVHMFELECC